MKNIAFITRDITTHGGTQRVISVLANAFINILNHKVFIYSLRHSENKPKYELDSSIKIINLDLDYKPSNFFTIIKSINKLNYNNSVDTVLGIGCYINLLLPFIKCPNRLACEHSSYDSPSLKVRIIRRFAYKFVEGVISLTKEDKKHYLKMNSNTYVIPNPIPFEACQYYNRKNIVVSIGRLDKNKGIDRLLDIWSIVEKKNNNYELKIYGDGPEKENLHKKCAALNLKRVAFMGENNNIQRILAESRILTLTSYKEGFSMVLLEAMACGVPMML